MAQDVAWLLSKTLELMTDWRDHLTPEERARLQSIKDEVRVLRREHRRIFDRARKRAARN